MREDSPATESREIVPPTCARCESCPRKTRKAALRPLSPPRRPTSRSTRSTPPRTRLANESEYSLIPPTPAEDYFVNWPPPQARTPESRYNPATRPSLRSGRIQVSPLAISKSAAKKANLFYFVFVMYAYTTAGPFGLEEQVTTSGPGLTLLYHLLLPLFWCIPVSLASAELTTAIPVEGGFYRWVRAGFGNFWGFLAGWWNWTAS